MHEWYLKMIQQSTRLDDAKNYAKMAGVDLDIGEWIRNRYMKN